MTTLVTILVLLLLVWALAGDTPRPPTQAVVYLPPQLETMHGSGNAYAWLILLLMLLVIGLVLAQGG